MFELNLLVVHPARQEHRAIDADERVAIDSLMGYAFDQTTRTQGWGTMDPQVWEEQIAMYGQLGQFRAHQPKVEDVMTMDVLKATHSSRLTV